MKRLLLLALGAGLAGMTVSSTAQSPAAKLWDESYRQLPQPANIRNSMQRLSARPHHVGSPYDKDNADWILGRFRE